MVCINSSSKAYQILIQSLSYNPLHVIMISLLLMHLSSQEFRKFYKSTCFYPIIQSEGSAGCDLQSPSGKDHTCQTITGIIIVVIIVSGY
jgi:hypothetical protein